jgi:hypothetical protein
MYQALRPIRNGGVGKNRGVIVDDKGTYVRIKWDNGYTDGYPMDQVIFLDEISDDNISWWKDGKLEEAKKERQIYEIGDMLTIRTEGKNFTGVVTNRHKGSEYNHSEFWGYYCIKFPRDNHPQDVNSASSVGAERPEVIDRDRLSNWFHENQIIDVERYDDNISWWKDGKLEESLDEIKFKIGDIVIAKDNIDGKIRKGEKGKIISRESIHDLGSFCVEWDRYIYGHEGPNDIGKKGHCWWVYTRHLELPLSEEEFKRRIKDMEEMRIKHIDIDPYGEDDWLEEAKIMGQRAKGHRVRVSWYPDSNNTGVIDRYMQGGARYLIHMDNGKVISAKYREIEFLGDKEKEDDDISWWVDGKLEESNFLKKFDLFKKKEKPEIGTKVLDINDKYISLQKNMEKLEIFLKKHLMNKEVTFFYKESENLPNLKMMTVVKNVDIEDDSLYFYDRERKYLVVTTELIYYKDVMVRRITDDDPYGEEEWDDTNELFGWGKKKKAKLAEIEKKFPKTPLYSAINDERYEEAIQMIDDGYENIDERFPGTPHYSHNNVEWTPLMLASLLGKTEIVEKLIEAGADVNARGYGIDELNWSPLVAACSNGRKEVVKLLVDNGVDDWNELYDCIKLARSGTKSGCGIDNPAERRRWRLEFAKCCLIIAKHIKDLYPDRLEEVREFIPVIKKRPPVSVDELKWRADVDPYGEEVWDD